MPQAGSKMNQKNSLIVLLEIIWWVATATVAFALIYPIRRALPVWPFQGWNIAFIVIVITFTRYIFLLRHTFLAKRQVLKVALGSVTPFSVPATLAV